MTESLRTRGVPPEQIPLFFGKYFAFLKSELGVDIYGNQTMMLLYNIDPARVADSVTPVPLAKIVDLFASADRMIVY
ncbi:MAG: hypothetical protein Q8N04_08010 [Nitrospira sp.]|nr:hypothetical protein [Nitrospira sp.]